MKKVLAILCASFFIVTLFVSCNKDKANKTEATNSNYEETESSSASGNYEDSDDIDLFSQALENLEDSGTSLFDSIMSDFDEADAEEVADSVNNAVQEAAETAQEAVSDAAEQAADAMEDAAEDLSDLLDQLGDSTSSWF